MSQLMSKSEQAKIVPIDQDIKTQVTTLSAGVSVSSLPVAEKTILEKVKEFLNKEVVAKSGIKWMYVLGAVLVFVLYVEFVADRKMQRKLKFW